MPEGKLRSGVYRSFIMCDDPRDVVECGAIKKQSKTRFSKPKERSEMAPPLPLPLPPQSSSLQLLRVSKGIQKLNVAIDSWSKGFTFEASATMSSRSEDIAKDLLRGALDLEESLAMLTSIQEEQKPKVCSNKDLRFLQRSMSDRFGERIEKRMMMMMVQDENVVASKDCYDELRNVIKESFLRQNLVSQTTTATETKKSRVVRSDLASSSGVVSSSSTSTSQSSIVSSSTKSSASSDVVTRRGPSLIARLMGLDVSSTHQEQRKNTVDYIGKTDMLKLSSEQLKKKKKKKTEESLEIVRSTREAFVQPSENPSAIVLIRPMSVSKKPRMQGEVHPRMMNQRKDHQAKGSNEMKLQLGLTKKDREPKEMMREVEASEGKLIKLMTQRNVKTVPRDGTNKKLLVKKENIAEGKDRDRPQEQALKSHKKPNNSSDMSRNKSQRSSRLTSSSSSGGEQKRSSKEKKSGEANRPNVKKKLRQQNNDLSSENTSCSSQDTRGSLNQLSQEETTSSEFLQGHCESVEVSSCVVATIQHTHEPETSSQVSLKTFLSSSTDFISYTENLFDINTNTNRSRESAFQNRDSTVVVSDQRIALDFAKEVARRRSRLLAEPTCSQKSSVHIDELLTEVCDEFECLRSYRDTFLGQESVQMALEKDLKGKKTEMTSGVWDLGWRSEFQIAETYQSVVDLEKLILSSLIQEIIS